MRRDIQRDDNLEQACLLLARAWFEKPAAARETVALGGAVDRFAVDPWPPEVRGLLAPYRRLGG